MSSPEPSFNESASSSPVQRLVIAIGTLVVVALTVIVAVLLAVQPSSSPTATPPLAPTQTVVAVVPTVTFTLVVPPTDTPSATPSPSPTPVPTEEPTNTPVPPTSTDTPPPTATPTQVVIIVTPTPLPTTPPTPAPEPGGGSPGVCQPPPTWAAYVVQSGDTLNSLSARTGVSVFDLQQVNCLPSFTLQPGQTLYLPFNPPSPTPTATSTPVTPSPTAPATPTSTPTPRPPEIFEINVSLARDTITIRGRYFEPNSPGFRVELTGLSGTLPPLELGQLRTSTGFDAKIPADLPGGDYDLRVINPDGQFAQRRINIPPPP